MSYTEALDWMEYLKSDGPLDLGVRIEQGFALTCMTVNRSAGGKAELKDFLPNRDDPEDEVEATPENVFALFQKLSKGAPRG